MSAALPMTKQVPERGIKQALWDDFCVAHDIATTGVPLFAADVDGMVEVFSHGQDGRPMLRRSAAMEALLVGTVEREPRPLFGSVQHAGPRTIAVGNIDGPRRRSGPHCMPVPFLARSPCRRPPSRRVQLEMR